MSGFLGWSILFGGILFVYSAWKNESPITYLSNYFRGANASSTAAPTATGEPTLAVVSSGAGNTATGPPSAALREQINVPASSGPPTGTVTNPTTQPPTLV